MLANIKVCEEISVKTDVKYMMLTRASGQTFASGSKYGVGEVLVCNGQLVRPWVWEVSSVYAREFLSRTDPNDIPVALMQLVNIYIRLAVFP